MHFYKAVNADLCLLRNTDTNVTTWEKPQALLVDSDDNAASEGREENAGRESSSPRFADILLHLEETLATDSNMFGTVANSHRAHGVFSIEFMDFLEAGIKQCSDATRRDMLERLQARIVNPLLKQGEYY
jgi:hypothetical protein